MIRAWRRGEVMLTARAYMTLREPLAVGTSVSQAQGVDWLKRAVKRAYEEQTPQVNRALELYDELLRGGHIATRTTCLPDYTHDQWHRMTLFRDSGPGGAPWFAPRLQDRMSVFGVESLRLAREAFRDDVDPPHAAIQVSCTGYASPHALQRTICEKGWPTKFLHIGHMGCHAAIPALALAGNLVSDESRVVGSQRDGSVLLIELCTLHLQ